MLTALRSCASIIAIAVILPVGGTAAAQEPGGPRQGGAGPDALQQARSIAAAGDTAGAIRLLRTATEKDPQNGPLWYEYGTLLSRAARPHFRKGAMPAGVPAMIIAADSSLARAMRLAPDSVHYAIAYGQHLWLANSTSMSQASRVQQGALARLEGGTDSSATAFVADQLGIMLWRRFEMLIGRGDPTSTEYSERLMNRAKLFDWIRLNHRVPATMYGLGLYEEALRYFHLASEAEPDNELYFRHAMMALAERNRWDEIEGFARARIAERPMQPWPWLVRGMSEQRRGRFGAAHAFLDSGYARLPRPDRERLTSIQRVLLPSKAKWYDSLPAPAQEQLKEHFWNSANPTLLLPGNALYDEYRARVVYAELRFTDDERDRPGASSHKGEIYIRYGPPDVVLTTLPVLKQITDGYSNMQAWVYYTELMVFTFGQNWGYGTAFQTRGSRTDFDSSSAEKPATWTNLPIMRYGVDSVSTQTVRFRAPGDSMDVAVFAGIRAGRLRRNSGLEQSELRHGVFLVDALGRELSRTTGTVATRERDTLAVIPREYFVRTTTSAQAVRVEALEPDALRAARSISDLSGFTMRGFGLSDLLVAAKVERAVERDSARWSDFEISALVGNVVPRGAPLDLLWESYEPGAADGKARLRFAVRVQRETSGGLVSVAGRVIGGIREALTGTRRNDDVTVSYEREPAVLPVLVDHVRVEVGRLEPGRYRVTLTATDLVRNVTVNRMQRFVVAPR